MIPCYSSTQSDCVLYSVNNTNVSKEYSVAQGPTGKSSPHSTLDEYLDKGSTPQTKIEGPLPLTSTINRDVPEGDTVGCIWCKPLMSYLLQNDNHYNSIVHFLQTDKV